MKQIASLAVLLLVGNTQAKKLSFASGMKGDEILEQAIQIKGAGVEPTEKWFTPNTQFIGLNSDVSFASGMKGDEMLDEAITLKTTGNS
jgi:hypothetical protein